METTIQIRIDKKTKNTTRKILDKLGLDMSTVIKMYFHQINRYRGIPFLVTENGLTVKQEVEILKASAEGKEGIGISPAFDTAEDTIKWLKSEG